MSFSGTATGSGIPAAAGVNDGREILYVMADHQRRIIEAEFRPVQEARAVFDREAHKLISMVVPEFADPSSGLSFDMATGQVWRPATPAPAAAQPAPPPTPGEA